MIFDSFLLTIEESRTGNLSSSNALRRCLMVKPRLALNSHGFGFRYPLIENQIAVEAVNHMDVTLSSAEVGPNWAAVSIAAVKMMELKDPKLQLEIFEITLSLNCYYCLP